jgi:hypothetical protein
MTDMNSPVDRPSVGVSDECPALVELAAHRATPDDDIERHIADCPRCSALLQTFQTASVDARAASVTLSPVGVVEPSRPAGVVAAGEILSISSARSPGSLLVVLVLSGETTIYRVTPLLANAELDDESVPALLPAQTPLGYEAVVDCGSIGWVDSSQIDERFGAVSPELLARVISEVPDASGPFPTSSEVRQLRQEASLFFLPTIGDLFESAEASEPALMTKLVTAGWAVASIATLRQGIIERAKVKPEQVTDLFRLAGWTSDSGSVDRATALVALRAALADPLAGPARKRKAAAMAFLAQVPGISRRLSVDEYVDAVMRTLDETD